MSRLERAGRSKNFIDGAAVARCGRWTNWKTGEWCRRAGLSVTRLVFLHPLVVTCAVLAPMIFLFTADAMTPEPGLLAGSDILSILVLLSFLSAAAQLGWVWSAYQLASAHARHPGASYSWGRPLFVGVAVILTVVFLLSWIAPQHVAAFQQRADQSWHEMFVLNAMVLFGAVGFFVCHWLATKALLAAELPVPRAYSWIGTFLFMVYLFLGVWFLRPRLASLRFQ
jgi:hypothetical protein